MKKKYQSPQIQMVRINTGCPILAGSPGAKPDGYNSEGEVLAPETHYWEF